MPTKQFPNLIGQRVRLSLPDASAAARMAAFVQRNRDFHAPTAPPSAPGFYTVEYWQSRLAENRREFANDRALRLVITKRDVPNGSILGTCNFTNIIRGPLQACILGFALDQNEVGKGLMFEAVSIAIPYVFSDLRLHRVQAGYLPTNERSDRLLRRLGFVVEGYARDYLFINGAWRDHVLTSLTNPHPASPAT